MEDTKPDGRGKRYAPYKKFIGPVVPNWIMKRTDLSQGAKLCFGRLAQFAGKDEYAFPGHEALANELAVSIPTIKGYLRELTTLGFIESQRMGSGNFSFYFFTDREGVLFRADGQKTIRQTGLQTDGENCSRHNRTDGQNSIRPVGQNSISPINREENHKENQEETPYENQKENTDDEIPW